MLPRHGQILMFYSNSAMKLPKLIDTCKQYMKHEQETLEKVTQARSRVSDARESH